MMTLETWFEAQERRRRERRWYWQAAVGFAVACAFAAVGLWIIG